MHELLNSVTKLRRTPWKSDGLSSIELLETINSNNAKHEYVEINSASNVGGSHTIIARSVLDCELRNQRQLLLSVDCTGICTKSSDDK